MSSKFEASFLKTFDEITGPALRELEVASIEKLHASATRTAALIEIALRTPHRAESLQMALKMEQGIVETVLAHAAVDGAQAIRDAAISAAGTLIDIALRA